MILPLDHVMVWLVTLAMQGFRTPWTSVSIYRMRPTTMMSMPLHRVSASGLKTSKPGSTKDWYLVLPNVFGK